MRILFIVPYVPSLVSVRPYNLLRHLLERGHDITLLTLYADEEEYAQTETLARMGCRVLAVPRRRWRSFWNMLRTLPTAAPLQTAYAWEPALAAHIDELLESKNGHASFDIVHVEHLRGARYALHVKEHLQANGGQGVPVVWDSVDCISLLFRHASVHSLSRVGRWMTRLDLDRTERYEGWLAQQFDHILMTSADDGEALQELLPDEADVAPLSILPNGVDLNYFRPGDAEARKRATLVISGKMSYHANVTMTLFLLQEIMPHVWKERSDVRVEVVGKNPPATLRSLSEDPRVSVTGTVPDLRPYLQQATAAVAPIAYGVGIQNKVLEAMACGTPVVATPQAVSALEAVPGRDLLVENEPASFAKAVLQLLNSPQQQQSLGVAGREYVKQYHNWETIAGQLERIYQRAIAHGRETST